MKEIFQLAVCSIITIIVLFNFAISKSTLIICLSVFVFEFVFVVGVQSLLKRLNK